MAKKTKRRWLTGAVVGYALLMVTYAIYLKSVHAQNEDSSSSPGLIPVANTVSGYTVEMSPEGTMQMKDTSGSVITNYIPEGSLQQGQANLVNC